MDSELVRVSTPSLSDSFVELIQGLHRELQLTVVMVTHDLDTLLALSTHVAVLADKRVIAFGTPEKVIKVRHPFIEDFFLGPRGRHAVEGWRAGTREKEIENGK